MEKNITTMSPRLNFISKAAIKGDFLPLDELWNEVATNGSPLMESTADENTTLVTFLWRESSKIDNVIVFFCTVPDEDEFGDALMQKLSGTDVWYKSFELPSQLRTTYLFSINDSLVPFTSYSDVMVRLNGYTTDPLNPKAYTLRSSPNEFKVSVLELPNAPRQPWNIPRKRVPRGQTKMHQFYSSILGTEHHVSVYLPPGYSEDIESYNVLVLFDGWSYYNFAEITTVFDNLQYVNRIPPYVVVMHTNQDQEIRDVELPCNEDFQQFLTNELMPWIHEQYNITEDPKRTVVAGSCFGGLAATFAALRAPTRFGNVISQSGSFWWPGKGKDIEEDMLIRCFEESSKLPIQFSLEIGSLETAALDYDPMTAHRKFRDVLEARGYIVDYEEYIGGHDMVCWRGTIVDRLLSFHPKEQASNRTK